MATSTDADPEAYFAAGYAAVRANVERVLSGKPHAVRMALTCLFAGGHLLVEDVPGVGKTSLAKAVAASIDASWHRIQFTPDLLPTDITGTTIYDQQSGAFGFRPGPVFSHIVLADEINRASPKTQSALLEVMEERQVTMDGRAHPVPRPFLVVATQNPIDLQGTYRLPEAQLDRFLLRIAVGYPDLAAERDLIMGRTRNGAPPEVRPVATIEQIRWMIEYVSRIYVGDAVAEYVARIAEATRTAPQLRLGLSPRGSLALVRTAQAWAAGEGRAFVTPDDVKAVAEAVLAHRLMLAAQSEIDGLSTAGVVDEILSRVTVPVPAGTR
ncbi:AAA family ATPase [Nonomuraea endophytica]|uniref:MoxR-like ATPase n=1 Tax=Nonomuraea endophytica TaxID=714136 RepID=A0A7W8EEU2_9ACTN|nr:MoxR family ATPase [Nonomuraea endophytica]MBB5076748.1 MoxR-like ATPase [Nonomuraea endophytica]